MNIKQSCKINVTQKAPDFKEIIDSFEAQRTSNDLRFASFDLCYYYFYTHQNNLLGNNLELSCMHLWSYLSSWGMTARGNELQKKSYAYLIKIIEYINAHPQHYNICVNKNNYVRDVLKLYDEIKNILTKSLDFNQTNKKTLITKIILGVYACCPAFDSRFCETFGCYVTGDLRESDLEKVVKFYEVNHVEIDKLDIKLFVFNRSKNKIVLEKYSIAKIIDMYGFERPAYKKINRLL